MVLEENLLIDLDYQANATYALLGGEAEPPTIANVLLDNVPISDAVRNVSENLDILPSTLDLVAADTRLSTQPGRDFALSLALQKLPPDKYEYILADLPPNAGVMVLNGLAASNMIIPIQMEFYAMKGVNIILDVIKLARERLNRNLAIIGALGTMYDSRKNICLTSLREMNESFGPLAFKTVIRSNVSLAVAPSQGKNIFELDARSYGGEDYMSFARELIDRAEGRLATEEGAGVVSENEESEVGPRLERSLKNDGTEKERFSGAIDKSKLSGPSRAYGAPPLPHLRRRPFASAPVQNTPAQKRTCSDAPVRAPRIEPERVYRTSEHKYSRSSATNSG